MTDREEELSGLLAAVRIKGFNVAATIIRADGTIEPQGVISGWHSNIFKHIALQLRIKVNRARVVIQRFIQWHQS